MVKLPTVADRTVLTQAARSSLSAADIANPYLEIAKAGAEIGQTLQFEEERDAAEAGGNAVTRDEAGNLQVASNPYGSYGRKAAIWEDTAVKSIAARTQTEIRAKGAEFARQANGDVKAFDQFWKGFMPTIGKMVPKEIQQSITADMEQVGAQYRTDILNQDHKRKTQIAANDLNARADQLGGEIMALARQGGTETLEFESALGNLQELRKGMINSPDFAYSERQYEIEAKSLRSKANGEAAIGEAERIYAAKGQKAALEYADGILTRTGTGMTPAEARTYNNLARERISDLAALHGVDMKPVIDAAKTWGERLKKGDGIDNPEVQTTIDTLVANGKSAEATELIQARANAAAHAARRAPGVTTEQRMAEAETLTNAANGRPPQYLRRDPSAMTRAMRGDVRSIISQAARRNGVDPNALLTVAMLESGGNPNAKNPSSSAGGLFQQIDSNAQQYGVANRFDPEQSAEGAARFMSDNARVLRGVLGRAATAGELYLAHQQGAGGASKLLSNPDAKAVDIVGADAVRLNGGRADMTAREFANIWMRKAGDIVVTASPDIDPDNIADARQALTDDIRPRWEVMKQGWERYGFDPQAVETFTRAVPLINDDRLKTEIQNFFQADAGAKALDAMPPIVREQVRSNLAADGVSLTEAMILRADDERQAYKAEALKKDPVGYAIDRGLSAPVPMLDLAAGDAAISQALGARQRAVDLLQARGEIGTVSILRPEDSRALGQFIQRATPANQAAMLGAFSRSLRPEVFKATVSELYNSPDTRSIAVAGALHADNPEAAEGVLRGRLILKENAAFAPREDERNRQATMDVFPTSVFPRGMDAPYGRIMEAARARYADLSFQAGDVSGDFNDDRMTQAINEITGGILEFNGTPTIAPRYGMSQAEFDDLTSNMTERDLFGAATSEGQTITAREVRKYGRFRSVGQGQYLIEFGTEQFPTYALKMPDYGMHGVQDRGGAFVLRLDRGLVLKRDTTPPSVRFPQAPKSAPLPAGPNVPSLPELSDGANMGLRDFMMQEP